LDPQLRTEKRAGSGPAGRASGSREEQTGEQKAPVGANEWPLQRREEKKRGKNVKNETKRKGAHCLGGTTMELAASLNCLSICSPFLWRAGWLAGWLAS